MQILFVIIYLILTSSGLILIKLGGNSGTFSLVNSNVTFAIHPISLIGMVCYIGSFFMFTKIVNMFDLSYILPITTGIVQVVSVIAAFMIFKEKISIYTISGIILVIIGIVLMNLKK